jgi:hypothetical protein
MTVYAGTRASWSPPAGNPGESPALPWLPPVERRRLSQLCRMTMHVIHEVQPLKPEIKTTFISMRGEVTRQFKIYETLFDSGEVLPAAFSLSVFNSAVAQASIACDLRGGYGALYPKKFYDAFLAAIAPLLSGDESETLLVYADEQYPAEYGQITGPLPAPLAFAVALSATERENFSTGIEFQLTEDELFLKTPQDFLQFLVEKPGQ